MKGDCGVSAFFAIYGRRAGGGRQFPARLRASEINAHTGGRRGQKKALRAGAFASSLNPLIKPIDYRLFPNWLLAIGSLSHSLESNTLEQTFAIIIHSEEGFFLLRMKRLSFFYFALRFFVSGPLGAAKGASQGFAGPSTALFSTMRHYHHHRIRRHHRHHHGDNSRVGF